MSSLTEPFTPREMEAARHLLFYYGHAGGYEPGNFTTQFIRTLEAADSINKARLLFALPEFQRPVAVCETQGVAKLAELITNNDTN